MKKRFYSLWISLLIALAMLGGGNALAGGLVELDFNAANFPGSPVIDNEYWPMVPGTVYTYFAETEDGCEWNIVDVTNLEYVVAAGVNTVVVLDIEWLDESDDCADIAYTFPVGDITEFTFDWYAQDIAPDDGGNIWYMGEDTYSFDYDSDDCEDEVFVGDPFNTDACQDGSFEAGTPGAVEGIAEAGIVMLAKPEKGDFYQQELDVENAEDWGKVLNFVPIEDNEDCLKTKEWTPLEPGAVEHKYYCPGGTPYDGLVLIEEVSGGRKIWVELIDVFNY